MRMISTLAHAEQGFMVCGVCLILMTVRQQTIVKMVYVKMVTRAILADADMDREESFAMLVGPQQARYLCVSIELSW